LVQIFDACASAPKTAGAENLKKETTLPTRPSAVEQEKLRVRADANFKKEERARDGAKAMMEYEANGRSVREQMARLRALRLAKEAKEAADQAAGTASKAAGSKR
jgi:hypothetical protein